MIMFPLLGILLVPPVAATQDWLEEVLAATELPVKAAEARESGVADNSIRAVLDVIRRRNLPAQDAYRVLDEEVRVVREGGPRENFGAFVQSQLDQGLRGRALADAIREEHRRRGIGGGRDSRDDRPGRPADRGRDDRGNDARDRNDRRPNADAERGRPGDRERRDTTRRGGRP